MAAGCICGQLFTIMLAIMSQGLKMSGLSVCQLILGSQNKSTFMQLYLCVIMNIHHYFDYVVTRRCVKNRLLYLHSSMEANLSLFVVSGQQLHDRTNHSKNVNHPVFSGHMQVSLLKSDPELQLHEQKVRLQSKPQFSL